jgi:hypothetical protein
LKPHKTQSASSLLGSLARLRRVIFGRIRVSRAGAGLRFGFGETTRFLETRAGTPAPIPEPRRRPRSSIGESAAQDAEFRQMHHELSIFLNGAKNRKSLRHLAFFEGIMKKRGPQALESVSIDTLKRAHVQLNLLLNVAPSRTLRVLSSKMLVALVAREDEGPVRILDNRTTDFMLSNFSA